MKKVRRKVVSWYRNSFSSNLIDVKLSCGHYDLSYLRKKKGEVLATPPDMAECRKCSLLTEEGRNVK